MDDATPIVTLLMKPAAAGSVWLPALDKEDLLELGFREGQFIVIDPGKPEEEVGEILSFGSIELRDPLKYDHPYGAVIGVIPKPEPAEFCPKCQSSFAEGAAFCNQCGEKRQDVIQFLDPFSLPDTYRWTDDGCVWASAAGECFFKGDVPEPDSVLTEE